VLAQQTQGPEFNAQYNPPPKKEKERLRGKVLA
jgi:hypothetical protein